MWIKTDEDVSKFISRVKQAAEGPTGLPSGGGMLDVVEHELRHAIRESAPGKMVGPLKKWVVTAHLTPTNYNRPESYVVEAETDKDAKEVLKHRLRDLAVFDSGRPNEKYDYKVTPFVEPPVGRVLGAV